MLFWLFFLGTHIHSCPILWGSGALVMQIANGSPHEECETLSYHLSLSLVLHRGLVNCFSCFPLA